MKTKASAICSMTASGVLCVAALLLGASPLARAGATIFTTANFCHSSAPSYVPDIFYAVMATINIHPTDDRWVSCPIPRTPLDAGAQFGHFYVDGDNLHGGTTSCSVMSYDYIGRFLGSRQFTTAAQTYDMWVEFPASLLPQWAYATLFCTFPGNWSGQIRGFASFQ